MRSRLLIIGMCILLMIGAIYIVGTSLAEDNREAVAASVDTDPTPSLPIEQGVFRRSGEALAYLEMPEGNNSLNTYYDNRAYPGAPPSIPHPLVTEKGIGGKDCLQCHQQGGFVKKFEAFAPVTPHPELLNCKQCHVPQKTSQLFRATNWEKTAPPAIHQAAMPGAPPVIPHDLYMRNNCLSCHAGPAAPKEIRVSHPERINCRQCHLPKSGADVFLKPRVEEEVFFRPIGSNEHQSAPLEPDQLSRIRNWIGLLDQ